jgi:hypothetical protein
MELVLSEEHGGTAAVRFNHEKELSNCAPQTTLHTPSVLQKGLAHKMGVHLPGQVSEAARGKLQVRLLRPKLPPSAKYIKN